MTSNPFLQTVSRFLSHIPAAARPRGLLRQSSKKELSPLSYCPFLLFPEIPRYVAQRVLYLPPKPGPYPTNGICTGSILGRFFVFFGGCFLVSYLMEQDLHFLLECSYFSALPLPLCQFFYANGETYQAQVCLFSPSLCPLSRSGDSRPSLLHGDHFFYLASLFPAPRRLPTFLAAAEVEPYYPLYRLFPVSSSCLPFMSPLIHFFVRVNPQIPLHGVSW